MPPRLAFAVLLLGVSACAASSGGPQSFESSAGYRLSYPAGWNVQSAAGGTFSARAADGREYVAVVRLEASPDQVLATHRGGLAKVSDRVETRQLQTASGTVFELWSSRTESSGQVGIYQQYFVAAGSGTLWVQHGCVEHGPEFENEAADRDCDDSGLAIVRSLVLT
jgi:hypothetical protein